MEEHKVEPWTKAWEEVNGQIKNGVNPQAFRLGFLAGERAYEDVALIQMAKLKSSFDEVKNEKLRFMLEVDECRKVMLEVVNQFSGYAETQDLIPPVEALNAIGELETVLEKWGVISPTDQP